LRLPQPFPLIRPSPIQAGSRYLTSRPSAASGTRLCTKAISIISGNLNVAFDLCDMLDDKDNP